MIRLENKLIYSLRYEIIIFNNMIIIKCLFNVFNKIDIFNYSHSKVTHTPLTHPLVSSEHFN